MLPDRAYDRVDRLVAERRTRPQPWGALRYDPIVSGSRPARPGNAPDAVWDHGTGKVLSDAALLALPLRRLLRARCVRPEAASQGAAP